MSFTTPRSKEQATAIEIAEAFHDVQHVEIYEYLCETYPEPLIRRAFGVVKELPSSAIKKSRGALFTYLVRKYAQDKISAEDLSD